MDRIGLVCYWRPTTPSFPSFRGRNRYKNERVDNHICSMLLLQQVRVALLEEYDAILNNDITEICQKYFIQKRFYFVIKEAINLNADA